MVSVSLRPWVIEGVVPFAEGFGQHATAADLLVESIVGLSNYSEEGLAYAPLVFVTSDLPRTLAALGGADAILVGSESQGALAARTALRSCAPLGEGRRWAVFLCLKENRVEYGLFRTEGSPLRPTSFELLRRLSTQAPPTIGLTQLRSGVVEVRSSTGLGRYFDFSGSQEEARDPGYVVQEFTAAVTSSAEPDVRPQLRAFYYRLGVEILTGDHGALAAVLTPGTATPSFLQDGNWLEHPVDLTPTIRKENATSSSEGTQALFAYSQLIRRMTMMDGIAVFGSDGTVRAYGCFLREPTAVIKANRAGGGARRRAYEVLRSHVGHGLSAALYRSQDGAADCVTAL